MIDPAVPAPRGNMGLPHPRYEGRAKVTGQAEYGSDVAQPNTAHAVLLASPVARGTIRLPDLDAARGWPGVLDILTYENAADAVRPIPSGADGGYAADAVVPLASPRIAYAGQPIALIVAESYECARDAARRLTVEYDRADAAASFDSAGAAYQRLAEQSGQHEDLAVGDVERALADATFSVDARYSTPPQVHNAIELFSTQCSWNGGDLLVYEPSQSVNGLRFGLAAQLGMPPERIRVVSRFVGGAFGGKGLLTQRTALVAIAARRLGRPVKLVATREQGFTLSTYRAETRHHVRIAADGDGLLTALAHESWELTSRADAVAMPGSDMTVRLYACPNIATKVTLVRADRPTPGFMRGPAEMAYCFALESAIDELAGELAMDPIALRRINDTRREPIKGLPYTSRSLMRCFDEAAEAFGWHRRTAEPRSMREGEWLVGWGCATSFYPTQVAAASARVRLSADGGVRVSSAGHELGQGLYTVMAQVAAEQLGVKMEQVTVELGDTDLPPAGMAAGSSATASICSAIMKACEGLRQRLQVGRSADGATLLAAMTTQGLGAIEELAEVVPHGAPADAIKALHAGAAMPMGGVGLRDRVQMAFGAQFVEVRIHARTREIRVPRLVGAFAAGRIINPRTVRSQLMGAMIWGVSSALHEAVEIDDREARTLNANLADYMLPVNADISDLRVILVPEQDEAVNPAGAKGVGEIGVVGVAAAIANAVHHATGRRIRDLPIRIEGLLDTP